MGLINYTEISDGTTIDAADVNTPMNTIYDEFNGGIDSNNLEDNAVTTAKITDLNVTTAKIAAGAVTAAKLDATAGEIGGVWKAWTPNVRPSAGSFTTTSGVARYTQIGKTVIYTLEWTLTNIGTGSGGLLFDLPVTAQASSPAAIGAGRQDSNGKDIHARRDSTTVGSIYYYDNTIPMVNGAIILISGKYEAA